MPNFKQPQKKSKDLGDGFISSGQSLGEAPRTDDIRKRFSKSYSPAGSRHGLMSGVYVPSKPSSQRIDQVKNQSEGFSSRSNAIDGDSASEINLNSDGNFSAPKHTKRRKFRRDKSVNKHSRRKSITRAFAVSFIALILGVGSLFAYTMVKSRNIFNGNGEGAAALQENVDPSRLNGEGDGRVNILLLGKGGPGHEAPDLTDTILLASIDPVQKETALLSIPRDLFVEDQNGNGMKINAIYSNAKQSAAYNGEENEDAIENAGLKALRKAVSDVIGVPIHYYTMVNFAAFEQAVDTVGGITVDVEEPLYDSSVAWLLGGNPLVADEGLQTFDGNRALLYARSRKGSARGDFDRTERQREIIVALQQKVLSVGTFANPLKVVELLDAFGTNVRTDLNGLGEVKRLYEIAGQIGPDKITSIGLADPPNVLVSTDFVANQSVVVPIAGLYQYEDIRSYVRNTLRDPYLKRENARIIILNGTSSPGLAATKETELKSYGYNVVSIGSAPEGTYSESLLINTSDLEKAYTQSYLEKRLGLKTTGPTMDGIPNAETADFVIILGEDEARRATSN